MKPLRCSSQSNEIEAMQRRWLFHWMQPWKEEVWGKVIERSSGPTEVGLVLVCLSSVCCILNLLNKYFSKLYSFVLLLSWQGYVDVSVQVGKHLLSDWAGWFFQTKLPLNTWFGRAFRDLNTASQLRKPMIWKGGKGFDDPIWEVGHPLLRNSDDGKWVSGLES